MEKIKLVQKFDKQAAKYARNRKKTRAKSMAEENFSICQRKDS